MKRRASTSEFRFGCEVRPDIGATARVGDVEPASAALRIARGLHAAGVVRVEVDRDADLLLQRADQLFGRVRLAQAGHVLDGQDVRAHLLQFLGQLDVILQVVLAAARVEDVAGVADGRLADRAGLEHGVHGHLHVRHPVERVEDAEQVDARPGPIPRRTP